MDQLESMNHGQLTDFLMGFTGEIPMKHGDFTNNALVFL
jgi:hypothetical protein